MCSDSKERPVTQWFDSLCSGLYNLKNIAVKQNLSHRDFSFNAKGGRYEHCEGLGTVVSNMLFFKDVKVLCPSCDGNCFQEHVLDVTYRGLNIHDVLKLSVEKVNYAISTIKKGDFW